MLIKLERAMNTVPNNSDITYFEITLVIGCSGNCKRYCAQEVLIERYGDRKKIMDMDSFHQALHNMPSGLPLSFGGYSEPFGHPEFIDFLKLSISHDHPIGVFSTLIGASKEQVEELIKLKYSFFVIHMPDGVNLKTNLTNEYMTNFFTVANTIRNSRIVRMDDNFRSCKREEALRGNLSKPKNAWGCSMNFFRLPVPEMVPDGVVYPCCYDMGLTSPMGNIFNEKYETIRKGIDVFNFHEFCKYCSFALSPSSAILQTCYMSAPRWIKEKILGLLRGY
jgi:hypothetical protein